jgi:hypothetical protein
MGKLRVGFALFFSAVALLGCEGRAARTPPGEQSLVRIDRTRCVPSSRLEGPREAVAISCAEAFVARNGYTDAPAVDDTAQLALESIEFEQSLPELRARRRNTLESLGYGVCPLGAAGPGLAVVFRYIGDTLRRTGRAVTMTADFDSLRVQHQDFILANVADSGAACHRVVRVRGQIREHAPAT